MRFVRLREIADALYAECYLAGVGWVEDERAIDVFVNGQDYDLIDAEEAERVCATMDACAD